MGLFSALAIAILVPIYFATGDKKKHLNVFFSLDYLNQLVQ